MIDPEMLMGGGLFALLAGFFVIFAIIGVVVYVYFAYALMRVAQKLKHPYPWLSWIPFANVALILQLGKFHWAWVFLLIGTVIPAIGIGFNIAVLVLMIISTWKISEKLKFPGWTSLLIIIPGLGSLWYLILYGILAWKK